MLVWLAFLVGTLTSESEIFISEIQSVPSFPRGLEVSFDILKSPEFRFRQQPDPRILKIFATRESLRTISNKAGLYFLVMHEYRHLQRQDPGNSVDIDAELDCDLFALEEMLKADLDPNAALDLMEDLDRIFPLFDVQSQKLSHRRKQAIRDFIRTQDLTERKLTRPPLSREFVALGNPPEGSCAETVREAR